MRHLLIIAGAIACAAFVPSLVGGFSHPHNTIDWPSQKIHHKFFTALQHSSSKDDANVSRKDDSNVSDKSRRNLLGSLPFTLGLSALVFSPRPAHADLIQYPCRPGDLKNTYNFMRAGESLIEEDGLWGSNPLFLTNRENALSDNGINQVHMACAEMLERDFNPSVVLYPTAANAIDTANIVATEMRIGRNRVMPEYTK